MNPLRSLPPRLFVTVLALGAAAVTASADPIKYRLNGGDAKPGDTVRADTRMTMASGDLTMGVAGQNMQGKMSLATDTVKVSKTITAEGGKPTVVEVFYEKDASSQKLSLAGQEIPHEDASPLQGVTVVRRRTGNVWTETLKEGTPDAKQKKRLRNNQPDDDEVLYPAGESAVGDAWTVPASSLKRLFGDDAEKVDGKVRCKFLRVEEYAGETCAVVGIEMDAAGAATGDGNEGMKMALKLHGTVYRSLKRAVDLKTDMQGDLKMEGSVGAGGATTSLVVTGPITITEKATVVP